MQLIPLIPIALLVATGLFVAEASAQTWTDVGPPKGPFEDVVDLAIDPTDQDHMFSTLGTANGQVLFESVDGGVNWQTVTLPGVGSYDPAVKFDRHGTVYLTVGSTLTPTNAAQYLFRRTATGTWTPFGPTTSFATQHLGRVFAVGYGDPDLMAFWLAERGGDEYGSSTYLYLSSDGGATWTAPYQMTTHPRTLTIVEKASGPHLIYSGSIFPSTGVEHFFARTTGWSIDYNLLQVAEPEYEASLSVSRRYPDRLLFARYYYLSVAWAAMPMLTSIDGGAIFTSLGPDGFFANVLQGNIHDGLMVRHAGFGAGEGPQVSWDTGLTWTSLPEVPNPGFLRYPMTISPDESHLFAYGRTGVQRMPLLGNVGVSECTAHVNSSGRAAKISAHGSSSLANNDLRLWVHDASRAQFGMFLVSRDAGFIPNPGGSAGDLCLGGGIGRYNALALHSGAYGEFYKSIDWNTVPSPTVPVVAQAGETWRFQCWFREGSSSQFSDAVAVTVVP